jgi:exopolyphosphatase/guanosine-5'-triphosphate,3'-diphosphate pyrophosphatase
MPSDDKPEVYAALDLGSNSFHLLIARFEQRKLIVIDTHKDMVRFAAGLDADNALSEEAINRALDSLSKMAERLRGVPADHIRRRLRLHSHDRPYCARQRLQ